MLVCCWTAEFCFPSGIIFEVESWLEYIKHSGGRQIVCLLVADFSWYSLKAYPCAGHVLAGTELLTTDRPIELKNTDLIDTFHLVL
jgi:hypothetical protein